MTEALPVVVLDGLEIHAITQRACIDAVLRALAAGRGGRVLTLNLHLLRRCRSDAAYAALCRRADLVVADGVPLLWASRLQGTPLPERVAGSDLILQLSSAAARAGRSIFLLGGAPGAAQAAARALREQDPGLRIAGSACPPPGFETSEAELRALAEQLRASRPDIVFLGLSAPRPDELAERFAPALPATWWIGVGVSFSFVAGALPRAPAWMQRAGLEWLHRLWTEPRRLARRYLLEGIPFALGLLVRSALRRRSRRREARR
jgi:N-acetylglucosaminyldiphosphoundecaprenol N-acetyl-beta-D-mannosaminyltransferase